jgi:Ca2+-binding RTX toxin-like protein
MSWHHRSRSTTLSNRRFCRLRCERLEDRSMMAILFGATGGENDSQLYTIDTATGVTTAIGSIGFAVTGLAVDPISGTLFGSTSSLSLNSPNSIITIDKTTGAGTLVGPVSLAGEEVADLTFDAAGNLFGWTEMFTDDLVKINTTTGAATQVGDAGIYTFGSGLADVNGTLFYSGDGVMGALRTVDKSTGLTTVVATLHGAPSNTDGIAAMAVNPEMGLLFGVALNDSDLVHPAYLVTINTATGEVTTIGALPNDFDAIAFDSAAPVVEYPDFGPGSKVVNDPFNPGTNILLVRGTAGNDNVILDRINATTIIVKMNGVTKSFLYSSFQKIVVIAGAGDDIVTVRASVTKVAELFGDAGNDQLFGGKADDIVHGGDGNDRLSGGAGHDVLRGGSGNDRILGDAGHDFLSGGDGHDQIWGEAGNDKLFGEAGNDFLSGGAGNDWAFGGDDADQIAGDAGDDVLLGEAGNDALQGGAGRDILIGGLGSDKLQGHAQDDILIGGTTSYDDNTAALAAILAEWVSARSFTVRVANIRAGIKTGGAALNSSTVFDDGVADVLAGDAGQDWVFAGTNDRLADKMIGERVN